jgi:hypothetical protein
MSVIVGRVVMIIDGRKVVTHLQFSLFGRLMGLSLYRIG